MQREQFYPIKKDAFLFPKQSLPAGDQQQQPEEAVRQWCAYELIRAYGIRIDELEFERTVKVGSKNYRIDILVSRRGLPWIVVECKEPGHTKSPEAMAQAISYADAQNVQAPFALVTNGQFWHVQRRMRSPWLSVPDLPCKSPEPAGERLTEILRALHALAPILHKLDEPIHGNEAIRFFAAMQTFFYGRNLLIDGTNKDLSFGTDNLLRVLAEHQTHHNYRFGKLVAARDAFESYRESAALGTELPSVLEDISLGQNNHSLHASLMFLIEGSQDIGSLDCLLLRLNVALTHYGMNQGSSTAAYPPLPHNLHRALGDFLDASIAINLNSQLPDSLDRLLVKDMQDYCKLAWDQMEQQPSVRFLEIIQSFLSWIGQRPR